MTRSYKKNNYIKDGYKSKWKKKMKRLANRTVRNTDLKNGSSYKKAFNSWNICDFKFKLANDKKSRSK